ncbi:MAG TPA: hypothetical protein VH540_09440 [Ktedonobacterales bacterium]|jgi:hypothetical protein
MFAGQTCSLRGSGSLLVMRPLAYHTQMIFIGGIPDLLQGMEHALAEEGKSRSAVAHALHQFEFVHFSFDDPLTCMQGQARFSCLLVSFHASHKALQLADLTVAPLVSAEMGAG